MTLQQAITEAVETYGEKEVQEILRKALVELKQQQFLGRVRKA